MKIYKTQQDIEADIKDEQLLVEGDVQFECSFSVSASLKIKGNIIDARNIDAWNIDAGNIDAWNIDARNIDAWNIDAGDIDAGDIDAGNIDAGDIDAWNIDAGNIDARNIDAGNIDARNIDAWNIDAGNISFYAICFAYASFKCKSIVGRRENAKYGCLDAEVQIEKAV